MGERSPHKEVAGVIVKRGARCRQVLPAEAFPANPRMKTGLGSWCRECQLERNRRWRAEHPEYAAKVNAARRVKHEPRRCDQCGETYTPSRADVVLCDGCRRERRLER